MKKRSVGLFTLFITLIVGLLTARSSVALASVQATATPATNSRIFIVSANQDSFGDFFVINSDGTGSKQVTHNLLVNTANDLIKKSNILYNPRHMTKGFLFGGTAVSPDGRYVALAWNIAIIDSKMAGDGIALTQPALYLVDGNSLTVQTVPIESLKRFSSIAFSRDGKLLAFVAERDGKGQIAIVDLEHDSKILPLVDDDTDKDFPRWSPDGKSLLYIGDKDGKSQVYVADADGSHPRSLTDGLRIDLLPTKPSDFSIYRHDLPEEKMEPNFSRDGKQIVFSSWQGQQIATYVMNADGSNIRQFLPYGKGGNAFWLDDQTFLVGSNRTAPDIYQIYSIKADGTGERRLTNHGGGLFNTDVSADGKQLVFDTGLHRVYIMNVDGTGERILRFNADYGLFWEAKH